METNDRLIKAFSGESQAYMTYIAFSEAARREGYSQAARLFKAIAEAEKIHALSHLKVMGKSSTTDKNLQAAIDGETYEFTEMYPAFIKTAESESNKRAVNTFKNASDVEKVHSKLYREALENLGKNEETYYYICPVCGNTEAGRAPGKCQVCGAGGDKFIKIE